MDERTAACFEITPRAADVVRATPDSRAFYKASGDPLTRADIASRDFLVEEIRKRFPDDTITAEDGKTIEGRSGYHWLADPLDGTLNFIRDMSPWAVSVAVLRGREVIAGCIAERRGDVFTASRAVAAPGATECRFTSRA